MQKHPLSKLLLVGDAQLCEVVQKILKTKFQPKSEKSPEIEPNGDKEAPNSIPEAYRECMYIENKYFESWVKIEIKEISEDADDEFDPDGFENTPAEMGYALLDDDDEPNPPKIEEKIDPKIGTKNTPKDVDFKSFDFVVLCYSEKPSGSDLRDEVQALAKQLDAEQCEVKMCLIDVRAREGGDRSNLVDLVDREEWLNRADCFIEIVCDDFDLFPDWTPEMEEEYQKLSGQSLSGDWQDKEGIHRLIEAVEGCIWSQKVLKPRKPVKPKKEKKDSAKVKKKKKKKRGKGGGGLFAMMGRSLVSGGPDEDKAVENESKDGKGVESGELVNRNARDVSENPEKAVREEVEKTRGIDLIEGVEDGEVEDEEAEGLDKKKVQDIEDFQKIFQDISQFKAIRDNLTDEQRREKAAEIVMRLMDGIEGDQEVLEPTQAEDAPQQETTTVEGESDAVEGDKEEQAVAKDAEEKLSENIDEEETTTPEPKQEKANMEVNEEAEGSQQAVQEGGEQGEGVVAEKGEEE